MGTATCFTKDCCSGMFTLFHFAQGKLRLREGKQLPKSHSWVGSGRDVNREILTLSSEGALTIKLSCSFRGGGGWRDMHALSYDVITNL